MHLYITKYQGDAINAVSTLGKDMDLIVCCGGDGTLNETVAGLIEAELHTPIGYIPADSTNDFANSLKLSSDVVEAAKQILNGSIHKYDVGKISDHYFTYVASFGAFTKISYSTPQNIKNALGHTAYILEGIQELTKIHKESVCIELDGRTYKDDYLFGAVCNSTSVGGVLTFNSKFVDMSDGKFEVLLIRSPKNIQEIHECVMALKTQKYNCNMITFESVSKIKVTANADMTWSLDGEKMNGTEEICIKNLQQRISLVY